MNKYLKILTLSGGILGSLTPSMLNINNGLDTNLNCMYNSVESMSSTGFNLPKHSKTGKNTSAKSSIEEQEEIVEQETINYLNDNLQQTNLEYQTLRETLIDAINETGEYLKKYQESKQELTEQEKLYIKEQSNNIKYLSNTLTRLNQEVIDCIDGCSDCEDCESLTNMYLLTIRNLESQIQALQTALISVQGINRTFMFNGYGPTNDIVYGLQFRRLPLSPTKPESNTNNNLQTDTPEQDNQQNDQLNTSNNNDLNTDFNQLNKDKKDDLNNINQAETNPELDIDTNDNIQNQANVESLSQDTNTNNIEKDTRDITTNNVQQDNNGIDNNINQTDCDDIDSPESLDLSNPEGQTYNTELNITDNQENSNEEEVSTDSIENGDLDSDYNIDTMNNFGIKPNVDTYGPTNKNIDTFFNTALIDNDFMYGGGNGFNGGYGIPYGQMGYGYNNYNRGFNYMNHNQVADNGFNMPSYNTKDNYNNSLPTNPNNKRQKHSKNVDTYTETTIESNVNTMGESKLARFFKNKFQNFKNKLRERKNKDSSTYEFPHKTKDIQEGDIKPGEEVVENLDSIINNNQGEINTQNNINTSTQNVSIISNQENNVTANSQNYDLQTLEEPIIDDVSTNNLDNIKIEEYKFPITR